MNGVVQGVNLTPYTDVLSIQNKKQEIEIPERHRVKSCLMLKFLKFRYSRPLKNLTCL